MKFISLACLLVVGLCVDAALGATYAYGDGSCHSKVDTPQDINSTISNVEGVLSAAETFITSVQGCGLAVPKDVDKLVKECKDIVKDANDVLHEDDKDCLKVESDEHVPHKCRAKLTYKLSKLAKHANKALKDQSALASNVAECYQAAAGELQVVLSAYLACN